MSEMRIKQLATMYSHITGVDVSSAQRLILKTPTGKAIRRNDPYVLYEHPTNNLSNISSELASMGGRLFSEEEIRNAMLQAPIKSFFPQKVVIKKASQKIKENRRKQLKALKSPSLSSALNHEPVSKDTGRVIYANKSKD